MLPSMGEEARDAVRGRVEARDDGAWEAPEREVEVRTDSGGSSVTSVTSHSEEASRGERGPVRVLVSK